VPRPGDHSGGGQGMHLQGPSVPQHRRTGLQCRSRRAHVIDEQHLFSSDFKPAKPRATRGERVRHIHPPAVCRQLDLRPRRSSPDERADDWRTKMTRDLARLIETPLTLAAPMQRHRHEAVDFCQDIAAAQAHVCGKRFRKRQPAGILERVDDVAQRPLVFPNRPRACDGRTPGAMRIEGLRPRQRISASVANRRCDRPNRSPATSTHTSR